VELEAKATISVALERACLEQLDIPPRGLVGPTPVVVEVDLTPETTPLTRAAQQRTVVERERLSTQPEAPRDSRTKVSPELVVVVELVQLTPRWTQ
jgi:hypothetical protein